MYLGNKITRFHSQNSVENEIIVKSEKGAREMVTFSTLDKKQFFTWEVDKRLCYLQCDVTISTYYYAIMSTPSRLQHIYTKAFFHFPPPPILSTGISITK